MGIKDFFRKVGNGIRRAGRGERDRALPFVGRIANPILGMIGALPGHISTIGRIGSGRADVLHQGISKIPNESIKDRVVGRIDQRHLNQVSITDNTIMITNPHTSLILSNHDIQWMRDDEQAQQRQQQLSGFLLNISHRIEQFNLYVEWGLDHPTLTDRYILVPLVDAILYLPRAIHSAATAALLSSTYGIDLQPLIDWCTSNESDISIPDDDNEAVSLNSCINICKTFRDTAKGPLALLSNKINELENKQPSGDVNESESTEFSIVNGYPSYYVKHGDISVYEPDDIWDNVIAMKISLPAELKNKLLQSTTKTDAFKIHIRNLIMTDFIIIENG